MDSEGLTPVPRDVDVPPPVKVVRVTGRQQDILEWAILGLSSAEIAAKMFVSEDTVKSHLRALFKLCGVTNRTQLASVIYRERLGENGGVQTVEYTRQELNRLKAKICKPALEGETLEELAVGVYLAAAAGNTAASWIGVDRYTRNSFRRMATAAAKIRDAQEIPGA